MAAMAMATFMEMLRNVKLLFTPITSEQSKMDTVDFVLLWIILFLYLQSCVAVRDR